MRQNPDLVRFVYAGGRLERYGVEGGLAETEGGNDMRDLDEEVVDGTVCKVSGYADDLVGGVDMGPHGEDGGGWVEGGLDFLDTGQREGFRVLDWDYRVRFTVVVRGDVDL